MSFRTEHLGSMFGCLPARGCVAFFAVLWLLLGFEHLGMIVAHFLTSMVTEIDEYGVSDSCQGTACHAEWRESFGTCKSERKSTFLVKYCIVATLAMLFAYWGLDGLYHRDHVKIKAFGWFQMGMLLLFAGTLGFDLLYCEICGKMSMNMAKDVLFIIPPSELDRLRAQGMTNIARMPLEQLKGVMKYDFTVAYGVVVSCLILVGLYVATKTLLLADKIIGGPLGLGPLFEISASQSHVDDVHEAKEAAEQLLKRLSFSQSHANAAPSYGAFPALTSAQQFPYVCLPSQQAPLCYGSIGALRQDQLKEPGELEYLGVMGL